MKYKIVLLANIMLVLVTLALLFLDAGNVAVSLFSIIVSAVLIITLKTVHGNILSFGFVFIIYNLLMHFAFGVVNFLISDEIAKELYASWVLPFLKSENYSLAILISCLAFESFTIAWLFGLDARNQKETKRLEAQAKKNEREIEKAIQKEKEEEKEAAICYVLGIIMLAAVLLYFLYLLISGTISLNMAYMDFRSIVIDDNNLFSWIIVFYATGFAYIIASSSGKKRAWGVSLFVATAVILLMTGNKGEVLYAVLASLGILGYQGKKLNKKLFLLLCVIMFVVIPVITATRTTGVGGGFSLEFASFTEPLLEIGMQIRCVVYSIDGVEMGAYDLMYGYSYLSPILRVLGRILWPLRWLPEIPVDLTSSSSDFSGFGFTQVAEGYLNFGFVGPILFFAILGYYMGKLEFKRMSTLNCCLVGSIMVIFVNMSRNTFLFVPGQITAMLLIYFVVKLIANTTMTIRSDF